MNTNSATCELFEELDHRANDGLEVSLLWNRADKTLKVVVDDSKLDERFELPAQPDEAMDVFRHPFAYATRARGNVALRRSIADEAAML
jgi:hypothetical protein